MNIFKRMSEDEKKRYATMSAEEQEAFRRQRERQEETRRESGRRVGSDEFDILKMGSETPGHTTEEDKGKNDSLKGLYRMENKQEKEKGTQKEWEHSYIYMQFVIDRTYSFTKVFPAVYSALQECMERIRDKEKEFPNIKVKYGLVMFNEEIEVAHFGKSCFTEREEAFMERLRKMRFSGGSPDGYEENINKAVETGIRVLEKESEEYANRGILLFTDSLPRERKPDFYSLDDCKNRGLRFAVCYMNNDEYSPMFKITDRDGDITEGGKNRCAEIRSLESLFGLEGTGTIQRQINDIMYKSSVLSGM